MANAQSAQEELQQSVILSEGDAEFDEEDEDVPEAMDIDTASEPQSDRNGQGNQSSQVVQVENASVPAEPTNDDYRPKVQHGDDRLDRNMLTEHDKHPLDHENAAENPGQTQDADDRVQEKQNIDNGVGDGVEAVHDADQVSDKDAEGEVDELMPPVGDTDAPSADEEDDEDEDEDGDDDEEDEAEGVGAVKIKPGETDEDESDSGDDASFASAGSDRESADEWAAGAENEDDEDEEDSEAEVANLCIFCKKDEENDPGEEFEVFLVCKGCGEHSHQQCARDAGALDHKPDEAGWKCPECKGGDSESESEAELTTAAANSNEEPQDGEVSPATSRRSTASKIARDLLPPQRALNKPDSHSVFNQLVLDEDPMDGSRVLRKRKTSSAADADEAMSLRKRRRNTSDGSNNDDSRDDTTTGAEEPTRPRSSRSLRLKASSPPLKCTISKNSRNTLLLRMQVAPPALRKILSKEPQPKKRAARSGTSRPARSTVRATAAVAQPPVASLMPSSYTQPFYSFYDKETDELKGKPYGGILTEAEADTSKTMPTKDDRRRFDEAKQKADEEWRVRILAMQAEMESVSLKKSKKASSGPASQIECIEFGGWEIDTWYAAPYPEEYSRNRVLYICEFCLKYMNSDYVAWRHKLKCPAKHPPGDEIYRQGSISFFEVDGRKNPVYCQNLCLLAKLFLGSKTLYYDVEPFLFYVLCEYDENGYHFVGYFSKEKRASSQNNVSCILTLPIHQRKGYGHLLIDFSYLLTRAEQKTGSPEKPLSDMGLVSYRNYWRLIMCKYLLEHTPEDRGARTCLSIRKISDDTGMMPDDVISALEGLRALVRDPQTKLYAFRVDLAFCHEYVEKWESKKYVKLNDKVLTWTPYVMGRSNATNFELGPALNAIAPREDEEENKTVQMLAESGIAAGDFAAVAGNIPKALMPGETTVLESTEPIDVNVMESTEVVKTNGGDAGNDLLHAELRSHHSAEAAAQVETEVDWLAPYKDIPPTRFEVFPPVNPKRPGLGRLNSGIARPVLVRPPASAPRPRPKRPAGGSSRKSSSRSKSGGSRRKTGGTGRGPGRWPKGTKKSDYGNADSGPGLPPAWAGQKKPSDALDDPEQAGLGGTVEVKQPRGKSGKEVETTAAHFEVKINDVSEESGSGSDSDSDEEEEEEDAGEEKDVDVVMNDEEDEDEEDSSEDSDDDEDVPDVDNENDDDDDDEEEEEEEDEDEDEDAEGEDE
ncbi:hypothetical protein PFICI_09937 [Pestalotiopsis fici W106-1]|uniref:Histone acetyltransferase n=1 Tax=Pestalotiopsis fici (strain W106-1 / CGMCC3.15140) TaxID=1229662 RepID=W3WVK3_PESFW|nr:uncharacterized protein PFICI_09937 [Pestalotiopsis fici W106-1]ETS77875.1 hypothetical protein PFICI_09937 [Pestalotiopsis fici W106-1]